MRKSHLGDRASNSVSTALWGLVLAGFGVVVLLGSPTQVVAQARGELQVTARVLPAAPGQASFAMAMGQAVSVRTAELFKVTRRSEDIREAGARSRRRVVTVYFLAN